MKVGDDADDCDDFAQLFACNPTDPPEDMSSSLSSSSKVLSVGTPDKIVSKAKSVMGVYKPSKSASKQCRACLYWWNGDMMAQANCLCLGCKNKTLTSVRCDVRYHFAAGR